MNVLLAATILRWLLESWKICAPLLYTALCKKWNMSGFVTNCPTTSYRPIWLRVQTFKSLRRMKNASNVRQLLTPTVRSDYNVQARTLECKTEPSHA